MSENRVWKYMNANPRFVLGMPMVVGFLVWSGLSDPIYILEMKVLIPLTMIAIIYVGSLYFPLSVKYSISTYIYIFEIKFSTSKVIDQSKRVT